MSLTPRNQSRVSPKRLARFTLAIAAAGLMVVPALAGDALAHGRRINWATLELNPEQQAAAEVIDQRWRKTYQTIVPQLKKDRDELSRMVAGPSASNDKQVMALQQRIIEAETQLHREAARTFLSKKRLLNSNQLRKLQAQFSAEVEAAAADTNH